MISLAQNKCTGCSGCYNICPVDAIKMEEYDYKGIFPVIDKFKCINCDLCVKTCPEINPVEKNSPREIYAALIKNKNFILNSTSGGIASQISKNIIQEGGVCYGCMMESTDKIHHIRISNIEEINKLQGSKYIYSNIEDSFKEIKNDLINGIKVLFIGSPCQAAGLKNYLRKNYDNLFLIDLICHGAPPYSIFNNYLNQVLNKKENLSVRKVIFRWKNQHSIFNKFVYGLKFIDKNNKIIYEEQFPSSPYITAFLNGFISRENCYNCSYSSVKRVGDLTLGDFWGLGNTIPTKLNIQKGVSMVLINTTKGYDIFNSINDQIFTEKHSIEDAIKHNVNLIHPPKRPINKDLFINLFKETTLKNAVIRFVPNYKRNNKLWFKLKVNIAKSIYKIKKHI